MGATDPTELALDDLKAERAALQAEEDAVSFVRRVAQGRLDLVRAESRRRDGEGDAELSGELTAILGRQVAAGSARPPRPTVLPADDHLLRELDSLCAELGFEDLAALDDAGLARLAEGISGFERDRSGERHELFERIDALTAELVRRYRDGAAPLPLAGDSPAED
ncbi:MAG: hypothetical protein WAS51_00085 [Ilumatobacteraceae bacterium]